MSEPIPTPRTDAESSDDWTPGAVDLVPADFARTLERELAEANKRGDRHLEELVEVLSKSDRLSAELSTLRAELEQAVYDCDNLREALSRAQREAEEAKRQESAVRQELQRLDIRSIGQTEVIDSLRAQLATAKAELEEARAEASRAWGCDQRNTVVIAMMQGNQETLRSERDAAIRQSKENEQLAEIGQALSELVWKHSVEGDDAYEVEDILESHYKKLDTAIREAEGLRREIELLLANQGVEMSGAQRKTLQDALSAPASKTLVRREVLEQCEKALDAGLQHHGMMSHAVVLLSTKALAAARAELNPEGGK